MEYHYLKNVIQKIKHASCKNIQGVLIFSEKRSYFLTMILVHLYKDEAQCYLEFRRLLQLLRKCHYSSPRMLKRQVCLADHLLILCILRMYLSWMWYLLPEEGKGSETTRDIMNWFFSVKVSSVLLNYSVSHSSKRQSFGNNKRLTL